MKLFLFSFDVILWYFDMEYHMVCGGGEDFSICLWYFVVVYGMLLYDLMVVVLYYLMMCVNDAGGCGDIDDVCVDVSSDSMVVIVLTLYRANVLCCLSGFDDSDIKQGFYYDKIYGLMFDYV